MKWHNGDGPGWCNKKHSMRLKTIINSVDIYLNRWSGITESDLDGVTKTFNEIQDDNQLR